MRNVIALILCRGNSKGIKNKNIKFFSGKPLMYWTIKSLKESKIIKILRSSGTTVSSTSKIFLDSNNSKNQT